MLLRRCHSPIKRKPKPGATCPTKVPIFAGNVFLFFLFFKKKILDCPLGEKERETKTEKREKVKKIYADRGGLKWEKGFISGEVIYGFLKL